MEHCDHCGPTVRAHWRATNKTGAQFTFCAHCASRHRGALMKAGWLLAMLPTGSCARETTDA